MKPLQAARRLDPQLVARGAGGRRGRRPAPRPAGRTGTAPASAGRAAVPAAGGVATSASQLGDQVQMVAEGQVHLDALLDRRRSAARRAGPVPRPAAGSSGRRKPARATAARRGRAAPRPPRPGRPAARAARARPTSRVEHGPGPAARRGRSAGSRRRSRSAAGTGPVAARPVPAPGAAAETCFCSRFTAYAGAAGPHTASMSRSRPSGAVRVQQQHGQHHALLHGAQARLGRPARPAAARAPRNAVHRKQGNRSSQHLLRCATPLT